MTPIPGSVDTGPPAWWMRPVAEAVGLAFGVAVAFACHFHVGLVVVGVPLVGAFIGLAFTSAFLGWEMRPFAIALAIVAGQHAPGVLAAGVLVYLGLYDLAVRIAIDLAITGALVVWLIAAPGAVPVFLLVLVEGLLAFFVAGAWLQKLPPEMAAAFAQVVRTSTFLIGPVDRVIAVTLIGAVSAVVALLTAYIVFARRRGEVFEAEPDDPAREPSRPRAVTGVALGAVLGFLLAVGAIVSFNIPGITPRPPGSAPRASAPGTPGTAEDAALLDGKVHSTRGTGPILDPETPFQWYAALRDAREASDYDAFVRLHAHGAREALTPDRFAAVVRDERPLGSMGRLETRRDGLGVDVWRPDGSFVTTIREVDGVWRATTPVGQ